MYHIHFYTVHICLKYLLYAVQRRAARSVSGQHDRAVSVTNIMAGLGWRSLQERRLESRLCMLYKTIKGTSACNIPAYIHPHSTSLRASHDQQYRVPHTTNPIDAYTYSFFPRTIRIWNILPAALVHASTIEGFKNGLHKEFLSGNMHVVSSRGQYDRPRLGSSASLPVVGPYTNHLNPWCIYACTFLILNTLFYICCFWTLLRTFPFNLHPAVGGNSRGICDIRLDWAFLRLPTTYRRRRRRNSNAL